jgi:hypothetical protein
MMTLILGRDAKFLPSAASNASVQRFFITKLTPVSDAFTP